MARLLPTPPMRCRRIVEQIKAVLINAAFELLSACIYVKQLFIEVAAYASIFFRPTLLSQVEIERVAFASNG